MFASRGPLPLPPKLLRTFTAILKALCIAAFHLFIDEGTEMNYDSAIRFATAKSDRVIDTTLRDLPCDFGWEGPINLVFSREYFFARNQKRFHCICEWQLDIFYICVICISLTR